MALRGDVNPDIEIENDFKYASDLVEYIMSKDMGFDITGACYPEVHQEAEDIHTDVLVLAIWFHNYSLTTILSIHLWMK